MNEVRMLTASVEQLILYNTRDITKGVRRTAETTGYKVVPLCSGKVSQYRDIGCNVNGYLDPWNTYISAS